MLQKLLREKQLCHQREATSMSGIDQPPMWDICDKYSPRKFLSSCPTVGDKELQYLLSEAVK